MTFPASVCDEEAIDGTCGCRRSMIGLYSLKRTTTVQVVYLQGGMPLFQAKLRSYWERAGWSCLLDAATIEEMITSDSEEIVRIASSFPVRTILEIRGDLFQVRRPIDQPPILDQREK